MNASTILARAKEPSTWAGLAALIGFAAQAWQTKDPQAIATVLAGLVAIVVPERKAPPPAS